MDYLKQIFADKYHQNPCKTGFWRQSFAGAKIVPLRIE